MRDLLARETQDVWAAEVVALFCGQVKKWIGAFATALGGLDTLVFAGGIGENAPIADPRADLQWAGISWHRTRRKATRGERFATCLALAQPVKIERRFRIWPFFRGFLV